MTDSPLTLTAAGLGALRERSRVACVVYPNHPMPPGTNPALARIGIESTGNDARLLVDRGLNYAGTDVEVEHWLSTGSRGFTSVDVLVEWLRAHTSSHHASSPSESFTNSPGAGSRPPRRDPQELTDLAEVEVAEPGGPSVDGVELEHRIRSEVIGQDAAVIPLCAAVARHLSKRFPRRPLTAMLVGPTGVGKTEAAHAIARALGDLVEEDWPLVRYDMAEFAEHHTVSRLLGAPPGYIGYGEENLASRLAANPRQIILFDEIDRAHPRVVSALMNLMDAGRLDSAQRGPVDAAHAVLLFTSNLGAADLPKAGSDTDRAVREHLRRHGLAPELVGRFGLVLMFEELDHRSLASVGAKAVSTVAGDYGVRVERIEPGYLSRLIASLLGNRLGVRAIEHVIEAELGRSLAEHAGGGVVVGADGEVTALPDVQVAGVRADGDEVQSTQRTVS